MTIRHRLKDGDTLEYLSYLYFGSPDSWQDIADYNNLVYPYLSSNVEDKYNTYATGFIRVTRDTARQPLTIKKHWKVKTKRSVLSATTKTYMVVEDVVIPAGDVEAYVQIRAILPGIQGNTSEGTVVELGDDFIQNDISVTIRNDLPIKGGTEGNIRVTGEFVYVPTDDETQLMADYGNTFSYDQIRYFYGEDLKMDDSKDLVVSLTSGDLQTVGYTDNLVQAVNNLFESEVGDVLSDFTFGNAISDIIGDGGLNFDAKQKLISLEIVRLLNTDDRLTDPVVNSITLEPSTLSCYVDVTVTVVKLGTDIQLKDLLLGGA